MRSVFAMLRISLEQEHGLLLLVGYLRRECVPERDRIPSLQCYGYPLEQEYGLLLLVGYLRWECVPERDRVPSLQCYGYRLEQDMVSCCSLVTSVILLPTSKINSTAFSFHAPPFSIDIGANWWVFASSWYFAVLLSAARFAAADAVVAVSAMYELA